MKKTLFILFFTLICFSEVKPKDFQDTLRPRYGISAGINLNYHFADFRAIPGVPNCCPWFEYGLGFGTFASVLYEYPVNNRMLIGLRGGYSDKNALLIKEEKTSVMVGMAEAEGVFEHSIDAKISEIVFEPSFIYRILDDLYISAGLQAGFFIQKQYEQKEEIIKPENTGIFIDTRTRIRNQKSGEINNMAAFDGSVKASFSYELPLNKENTLLLVPELSFTAGVLNIVNETSWKTSAVSAGVTLKYSPFETVYLHRQRFFIDTAKIKTNTHTKPEFTYGKPDIVKKEETSSDSVIHMEEVYRTDTLFLPKERSVITYENFDTLRLFSKEYIDTTFADGSISKKHSQRANEDTVFQITNLFRTDTLFIPYKKVTETNFNIDTVRKESEYFNEKRYTTGKERTETEEVKSSDTLYSFENVFRTDTLFIPLKRITSTESNIDTVSKKSKLIEDTLIKTGLFRLDSTKNRSRDTVYTRFRQYRTDTLLVPDFSDMKLKSSISVFGLVPSGDTVPLQSISLQMQFTTEVYPLLPYIFFNENSTDIPSRYNLLPPGTKFENDEIEPNPIDIHHNNLNIIADRLKNYPEAKITINGYVDPYTETGSCGLALQRALSVKQYLVLRGAPANSILINAAEKNCYAPKPTRSKNQYGYAENRRAVIESDYDDILAPVYGKRYLNPVNILPDTLLFDPEGSSYPIITRWILTVSQAGETVFYKSGTGRPEKIKMPLKRKEALKIRTELPLNIEYKVFNKSAQVSATVKALNVIQETDNYEVERLSLTLFPVGLNTLTGDMEKQTSEFLKGLGKQSTVQINAYCDILGGEKTNKFLAETRAENIYRFIRRTAPSARITDVKALGDKDFPSGIESYNLPEERFLSRTVAIEIKKRR